MKLQLKKTALVNLSADSATLPAAYSQVFSVKTKQLKVAHHLLCGDPLAMDVILQFFGNGHD